MTTVTTPAVHTVATRDRSGRARAVKSFLREPAPVGSGEPRPGRGSEFATIVEAAVQLPWRAGDEVEILLNAARPFADGVQPLQPFWNQEATHRAASTLRLFVALRGRRRGRGLLAGAADRKLALHLADQLACLETASSTRVLPCAGPLREVARDLVALFGAATGDVAIDTDVTPVSLPAYKRRALVLLGHELVANALLHAFPRRRSGRLMLRLRRSDAGHALLEVGDDGVGFAHGHPNYAASVSGGLANLLEGELRHVRTPTWSTIAQVVFPVPRRSEFPVSACGGGA